MEEEDDAPFMVEPLEDEPFVNEPFVVEEEDIENENDELESEDGTIKCVKLEMPDHIAALVENRKLIRDSHAAECDSSVVETVMSNYVIVKEILGNLHWQDKLVCKLVSNTWRSAVKNLHKEQLSPQDFVLDMKKNGVVLKQSDLFSSEPLVVFTFVNMLGFDFSHNCKNFTPATCDPPCDNKHCCIDFVHHYICSPKDNMLTVKATYLCYLPITDTNTYENLITQHRLVHPTAFLGGVVIPKIPDVEYHVINIKSNTNMQRDFYDVVKRLSKKRIVKGALVYVTEKYLLDSVEDIVFLNGIRDLQPTIPYALGGCVVLDSITDQSDIHFVIESADDKNDFTSENLVTIGLFTVDKKAEKKKYQDKCNFEMYSLLIESSDWSKNRILEAITDFSKKVPTFEHSVALKLSCVGRDQKHKVENEYFRLMFPNTRIIGCYGDGELGINHPAPPPPIKMPSPAKKRHRHDPGPQYGIMYSYSTVFVLIGWGKILAMPAESPD